MPGDDRTHWLWRLEPSQWLAASAHELAQAETQVGTRRTALTHARRAAGMALNAVLAATGQRSGDRERAEHMWGRSYLDHLRAAAQAASDEVHEVSPDLPTLARTILEVPVQSPTLVQLGRGAATDVLRAIEAARAIHRACAVAIGEE